MDANLFYAFNLLFFVAFLISGVMRSRNDMVKVALPFLVGMLGIIVMASVNADGGLTTPTSGTWPALYIPLFATVLNFGMALYNGFA